MKKTTLVFIVYLMVLTLGVSAGIHYTYGSPLIWTDKPDYSPGDTAIISGSGFLTYTTVNITITYPDLSVHTIYAWTDGSGAFNCPYPLNGIIGTYTVTATDGTNTATPITFTDAVKVDFTQYATKDDKWIGGILQDSNSIYYECMSVPQRVIFVDIASTSGDVHTLTLSHEATKSGLHGYDWLTRWNQGNVPPLGYTPWGDEIGPHADAAMCQALHGQTAPYEIYVDVPDDPFISKDGSTQARINAYEAAWGNRQIRICGNQPITSASFTAMSHDVANGGDTGDSYIDYTLTWTSESDQILIELAGHLAVSGDPAVNPIAWGVDLGSSQIAGGPYHFKLGVLDGHNLGSQDNQIKGADILIRPGKIIVDKITVPAGSSQSFTFTTTGSGYSGFSLTDAAAPNDSGWLVPGTYSVTETVPTGWGLTAVTKDGVAFTNGGNIVLGAGQIVYVNFTDAQRGKIIVDKITVPAGSSQSFTFTPSYGSAFGLTDAGTPVDSGWLVPGTYSVTETVPGGWDLTSVTRNGTSISNGASFALNAGDIIWVNFTDTQRGHIIVHKATVPAGDPADFTFDPDYQLINFVLSDGEEYDSGAVVPGTYHVQELALAGWDLTAMSITDPSGGSSTDLGTGTATIGLAAGETVHVYYTNTIKPPPGIGNIIVEKITLGGVGTFDFVGADTTLPAGFNSFSIATVTPGVAASTGFTNVNLGTYTLTEQALTGWDLTDITINDPDGGSSKAGSTATLDVDSGETVTVTFTNTKRGKIIVDKITVPASDPQSFTFTTTGSGYSGFSLTDAADPNDSGWLVPGTYTVTETVPTGWDLTSVTVNGAASSNGASLTLNAGQILYVNFTDTQRGHIIVHKTTVPAGDPAVFEFDPDYQVNFVLSHGQQHDSGAVVPGTYHVQELALADWDLTGLTVTDPSGGSSTDLGTGTATIGLAAGETVDVYYTNNRAPIVAGKITVVKDAIPNDPEDFSYSSDLGAFSLDDDADPTLSNTKVFLNVAPGTYTVVEGAETWWTLTSIGITGDDDYSSGNTATRTATINVDPGEDITITFTNTGFGKVTVVKDAVPNDPQDFAFSGGLGAFSLDDDADATLPNNKVFTNVAAGSYAVTETVPTYWSLSDITISGDTDGGSVKDLANHKITIDLDPGEEITITFVDNGFGKIIVDKVTIPANDPQSFDFSVTGPNSYSDSFSLTDVGAPHDSGWIKPGTYAASETVPTGWDLTSAVCSDGSPVNAIVLDSGETVTVTFTNTKRVPPTKCTISDFVWKDLDHDGIQDVGEPGFPGVTVKLYDSSDNLVATTTTNGNGLYSFTVDPGSYYLEFVPPSGYVLTLQDQGANDAKDSDPNPTTHKTATFTVTSGQTDSTRDTGMYATAPPPPVGGVWVSTDKLRLLTPWIGSACLTMAILASFVCFKRKKKRMG